MVGDPAGTGWARIVFDPALLAWARAAEGFTDAAMRDPDLAQWWVCENTWFVGVDALPNDAAGTLPDGTAFPEGLKQKLDSRFGAYPFHKAQLSVVRPGYPKPREGESDAAFGYRLRRDAAHVDGLKPEGPERRRMVKEPHAYILGVPLNDTPPEAAPLVVWQGSHEILRTALHNALAGNPPEDWSNIDLTDVYQAARRDVFETCERIAIHARPGEAYLLHRLALHGVAPWRGATEGDRRVAYFRPALATAQDWIELD